MRRIAINDQRGKNEKQDQQVGVIVQDGAKSGASVDGAKSEQDQAAMVWNRRARRKLVKAINTAQRQAGRKKVRALERGHGKIYESVIEAERSKVVKKAMDELKAELKQDGVGTITATNEAEYKAEYKADMELADKQHVERIALQRKNRVRARFGLGPISVMG